MDDGFICWPSTPIRMAASRIVITLCPPLPTAVRKKETFDDMEKICAFQRMVTKKTRFHSKNLGSHLQNRSTAKKSILHICRGRLALDKKASCLQKEVIHQWFFDAPVLNSKPHCSLSKVVRLSGRKMAQMVRKCHVTGCQLSHGCEHWCCGHKINVERTKLNPQAPKAKQEP